MVARGEGWGMGKMAKDGKKIQTSRYKINKSWDIMYSMVSKVNNIVLYT